MGPDETQRLEAALNAFFARAHQLDVDLTMQGLTSDPHYEFVSAGWKADGREAVREALRRLYQSRENEVLSAEQRVLAVAPNTVCRESFTVRPIDGSPVTCRSVAVMTFEGDLLAGERLYTDAKVARVMNEAFGADFGDVPGVSLLS